MAVAQRFCDNILEQNARMQALVEKLLQQAKLENRLEIVPEPVLLASLFATLAELHASTLLQKSVRLTIDPAPGSLRVAGDEALLHQAIGNLLVNALDFTPPGGEITLGAWQEGERVIVRVTDTGSGIPDYALARIFERFYSLPRASGQKSSGLGLAFVQEVARLHQGEIALVNRPEGGVEARLTLPLA
ncbi:Two-component response regulator CreC [Cronobacter sakazakii 701]|nr:Two-component response regulator CreC [Cronobacter sakazakii 701]